MALAAYRHILRSTRIAFQGDLQTLVAARSEARTQFEQNRNLSGDGKELTKSIQHAEGVARILRENVVQGIAGEDQDPDRFKLRIHEATEKGDNESIGTAGKGTLQRGARCS